jgi:hypothetical protein
MKIYFAAVMISLAIGLILQYAHGQDWYITRQNVGPLENFTRTAQNRTQYTCQEGSAGKVIGCTPIETVTPAWNTTQQTKNQEPCTYKDINGLCTEQTESNTTLFQFEKNNQTRTLSTCYTQLMSGYLLASIFVPTVSIADLLQLKPLITNYCNFYHEKTGIWLDAFQDKKNPQIEKEFELKHKDDIEKLRAKFNNTR